MLMKVQFQDNSIGFDVSFDSLQTVTGTGEVETYTGAYEITPRVDAQTLPTAQKFLTDDMKVNGIPYFVTSNTSEGETAYIGTEVEIYGD